MIFSVAIMLLQTVTFLVVLLSIEAQNDQDKMIVWIQVQIEQLLNDAGLQPQRNFIFP